MFVAYNCCVRWTVLLSDEVSNWYLGLSPAGKAATDQAFKRLAAAGNMLRMPLSKALGDGLFELRFTCEGVARRITYIFDSERQAVTLTTFHRQRNNERREILRARRAQRQREGK